MALGSRRGVSRREEARVDESRCEERVRVVRMWRWRAVGELMIVEGGEVEKGMKLVNGGGVE
jgi:hypothetical protein